MDAPQTWLPTADAARAAGITAKALRRRIERGTVLSELREDGRRWVHVESVTGDSPGPGPADRGPGTTPPAGQVAELLARVEMLAAENGRLKALTAVAESTERALTDELHEQRAAAAEERALREALEAELAEAGPIKAWRIARQRRRQAA